MESGAISSDLRQHVGDDGSKDDLIETPMGRFTVRRWGWVRVNLTRIAVLGAILLLWEYLPEWSVVTHQAHFLNRFFVSSPVEVSKTLWGLLIGSQGRPKLWAYLTDTLKSTVFGSAIGVGVGSTLGLLASNDFRVRQTVTPFVYAANAVPKIAIIPVIIVMLGPGARTTISVGSLAAFFMVFFNAFNGGRAVPMETLQNARMLGARPRHVMFDIRLMYVVQWTFAAMPNAISHALLAVVTAEVLSGSNGMGRLIVLSLGDLDSSLTFSVVVVLAVTGIVLVSVVELARRKILFWAPGD